MPTSRDILGRSLDRERVRIMLLIVLYLVTAAFVLSHPHSFASPTIPDERAYYGWGELYARGVYDLPLQDWTGIRAGKDIYIDQAGLHTLHVEVAFSDMNGTGVEDDLKVHAVRLDGRTASPASGARVELHMPRGRTADASVDAAGDAVIPDLPEGFTGVDVRYTIAPGALLVERSLVVSPGGLAYQGRLSVEMNGSGGGGMEVRVYGTDIFDDPISGANVTIGGPQGPVYSGMSGTDGRIDVTLPPGVYHIEFRKDAQRGDAPFATVVVVDGRPRVVNHWAPGYSFLLAVMITLGIQDAVTLILLAAGSISIYMLVRWLKGPMSAFFASAAYMTAGMAIALVWSKGMADYATLTFACAGISALVGSLYFHHQGRPLRWLVLGLAGGLLFAGSVWMRYSTASMLGAVLALFLLLVVVDVKEKDARPTLRRVGESVRQRALQGIPFLIGVLLLATPLAMYNAHYFGSPFNSGYSYGSQITVTTSEGGVNASVEEQNFYSNFDPAASLSTLHRRVQLLPLVMAPVLAVPVVLAARRRDGVVWWGFIAFASNFFLYLFVPWAAAWDDITRSLEDMRYFLPSLIGAAMLCGLALSALYDTQRVAALTLLVMLVLAGFASAGVVMDMQSNRPGPPQFHPPPPDQNRSTHDLVEIVDLVIDPMKYNNTLVEVRNATFLRYVNPTVFLISDGSTNQTCAVRLNGYTPPPLVQGDRLTVRGMFTWVDLNANGLVDDKEMSIGVKGGTSDGIWKT